MVGVAETEAVSDLDCCLGYDLVVFAYALAGPPRKRIAFVGLVGGFVGSQHRENQLIQYHFGLAWTGQPWTVFHDSGDFGRGGIDFLDWCSKASGEIR